MVIVNASPVIQLSLGSVNGAHSCQAAHLKVMNAVGTVCFLADCCSSWIRRRSSSRRSTDHCAQGFRLRFFGV